MPYAAIEIEAQKKGFKEINVSRINQFVRKFAGRLANEGIKVGKERGQETITGRFSGRTPKMR